MAYCKSCVTPNTRPNGSFNSDGICSACEFSQQSHNINYAARLNELSKLVAERVRHKKNERWQCIVGVSGGKDSTRQALWVREKLNVNPLLVCVSYPPRQITQVGADNLSNLIKLGFDTLVVGPAPRLSAELVKSAFFRFCNWCKATEMALFSGVQQVAIDRKIPLVLWGENPALQVGDMGMMGESIWDGKNLVNSNTLAGGELAWFREVAKDDRRLSPYKFPSRKELQKAGIQTLFLGPAWEDWSSEVNSSVSIMHGLSYREDRPENTGDLLGTSMVDEDWTIVNNLLKFYKLGFSSGTERANEFIRRGQMTREEGILLAESYDGSCDDKYIRSFCQYISISGAEFWGVVKKFANANIFDLSGDRPVKRFKVGHGIVR